MAFFSSSDVLSFAGVPRGYTSLSSSFTVSGGLINASAAAVTGGNVSRVGNGVKVDVQVRFADGVLQAT
jgi:hypothetical protein